MKNDPLTEALAGILREEREKRGLSLNALSKKARVSRQSIGYFEQGLQSPLLENVVKIAAGLGLDLANAIARAQKRAAKEKFRR